MIPFSFIDEEYLVGGKKINEIAKQAHLAIIIIAEHLKKNKSFGLLEKDY